MGSIVAVEHLGQGVRLIFLIVSIRPIDHVVDLILQIMSHTGWLLGFTSGPFDKASSLLINSSLRMFTFILSTTDFFSGAWGILFYNEVTNAFTILKWITSAFVTISGILLLGYVSLPPGLDEK